MCRDEFITQIVYDLIINLIILRVSISIYILYTYICIHNYIVILAVDLHNTYVYAISISYNIIV